MNRAVVNKIIPFSSVDGPGNRTAVFLQGCNINCKYCHNPETINLCGNCGGCVPKCPQGALELVEKKVVYHQELCDGCDTCIHMCPNGASPKTSTMSAKEVFDKVKRQIPYIRGITVSGGEYMLYPEFLEELFTLAKEAGLHTLIDSNGTISFRNHESLMNVCDGVMMDIKAYDSLAHKMITDADNEEVLENAIYLATHDKLAEVRCVIVPDLYNAKESVKGIGKLLGPYISKHPFRIKLIRFRPQGVRAEYAHYKRPEDAYMNEIIEILGSCGFTDVVVV